MREYLKMAFRNILRNKRRSLITGLALLIGGFIFTFGQAYCDGIQRQLISSLIAANTGHIMIITKNEKEDKESQEAFNPKRLPVEDSDSIINLIQNIPGVTTVTKRANINGMISNGFKMNRVAIRGIESGKEKVTMERVIPPEEGHFIRADETQGIYISRSTADDLHVGIGDSLSIVAQLSNDNINSLDLQVVGIFKKTAPWMDANVYVNLATVHTLLVNQRVDQITMMINSPSKAKVIAAEMRKLIPSKFNIEVQDWEKAGSFSFGIVLSNKVFIIILWVVLFIIIAATIMNTMLMAVFERVKEMGTMMAIGMKRFQVLTLILTESFLLSLMAAGLGILLGGIFSLWLGVTGIPAFNDALRYSYGGDHAYPYLTIINVVGSYVTLLFLAIMASIYPAITATKLNPVKALNYI